MLTDTSNQLNPYKITIRDPNDPDSVLEIAADLLEARRALEIIDNAGQTIRIALIDNSLQIQSASQASIEITGQVTLKNVYIQSHGEIKINAVTNITESFCADVDKLQIYEDFSCASSAIKAKNMFLNSGRHNFTNSILEIEKYFYTDNNSNTQIQNSQINAHDIMLHGKTDLKQTSIIANEMDIAAAVAITSSTCKIVNHILHTDTSNVTYANSAIQTDRFSSYGPSTFNSSTLDANVYRQNGKTEYHNSRITSKECIDINDLAEATSTIFVTAGNIVTSNDMCLSKGYIIAKNYYQNIGCLYTNDIIFKITKNFITALNTTFYYNEGTFTNDTTALLGGAHFKEATLDTRLAKIFSYATFDASTWNNAQKFSLLPNSNLMATNVADIVTENLSEQGKVKLQHRSAIICNNLKGYYGSIIQLYPGSLLYGNSIEATGKIHGFNCKFIAQRLNLDGELDLQAITPYIKHINIGYSGKARINARRYQGESIISYGQFEAIPGTKMYLRDKATLELLSNSTFILSDLIVPTLIAHGTLNTKRVNIIADKRCSLHGTLNATDTFIDTDFFWAYPWSICNAERLKLNSLMTLFFPGAGTNGISNSEFNSLLYVNPAFLTTAYTGRINSLCPVNISMILPSPLREFAALHAKDWYFMLGNLVSPLVNPTASAGISGLFTLHALYNVGVNLKTGWQTQRNIKWDQQKLRHYVATINATQQAYLEIRNIAPTAYSLAMKSKKSFSNYMYADNKQQFPTEAVTTPIELVVEPQAEVDVIEATSNPNVTTQAESPVIEQTPQPIAEPPAALTDTAAAKQPIRSDNILTAKVLRKSASGGLKPRHKPIPPDPAPGVAYSAPQPQKKKKGLASRAWKGIKETPKKVGKTIERAKDDITHAAKVAFKYVVHEPAGWAGDVLYKLETESNRITDKIPYIDHMSGGSKFGATVSSGPQGGVNIHYQQSPAAPTVGIGINNNGEFAAFVDNKSVMPIGTPPANFLDIPRRDLELISMAPPRLDPESYEHVIMAPAAEKPASQIQPKSTAPEYLTANRERYQAPPILSFLNTLLEPKSKPTSNFLDRFRTKSKEQAAIDRFNTAEQFSRRIEASATDFWQENGDFIRKEARFTLPMIEHINNNELLFSHREDNTKSFVSFSNAAAIGSGIKSKNLIDSQQIDYMERIGNNNFSLGLTDIQFTEIKQSIESNQANPLLIRLIKQSTRQLNLASVNMDTVQLNINLYSLRTSTGAGANLNGAQVDSRMEAKLGNLQIQVQNEYCDRQNVCVYYTINLDATFRRAAAEFSGLDPIRFSMPNRPDLTVRIDAGISARVPTELEQALSLDDITEYPSMAMRILNGQ